MALKPVLKVKIDEFFLTWLGRREIQEILSKCLRQIKNGETVSITESNPDLQPVSPSSLPCSPSVSRYDYPAGVLRKSKREPSSGSKQTERSKGRHNDLTEVSHSNRSERSKHDTKGNVREKTSDTEEMLVEAASKILKNARSSHKEASKVSPAESEKDLQASTAGKPQEKSHKLENGYKESRSIPNKTGSPPSSVTETLSASQTASSAMIPPFYFPLGTKPGRYRSSDPVILKVNEIFKSLGGRAGRSDMEGLTKACGLPLHLKVCLFEYCGGTKEKSITRDQFVESIGKLKNLDDAAALMTILTRGDEEKTYLEEEDFMPLVKDVVETHPGLNFLQEAPEFHSRYIQTVIARIFFSVNRSWSGKITLTELRRSNLPQVIRLLEEEDDINQITSYFSYEHFYVIYCKFWELDKDHDLFISKEDLAQHNEHSVSFKAIERIFTSAITKTLKHNKISYKDFVWFLIAEEDKKHPTSIEYWFRIMDLDGDGVLSLYEMEYFYQEQINRMEQLGVEPLPFDDTVCQILDMVKPEEDGRIRLMDLKKCKLTSLFFDTFLNIDKYLDHEQKDPFTNLREIEENTRELSDWERYAAEEYEVLVQEEGNQMVSLDDDDVEWMKNPQDGYEKDIESNSSMKNFFND